MLEISSGFEFEGKSIRMVGTPDHPEWVASGTAVYGHVAVGKRPQPRLSAPAALLEGGLSDPLADFQSGKNYEMMRKHGERETGQGTGSESRRW